MILSEFSSGGDCGDKIKILAIVGPTATGKSEMAVKLAKKINGEIISADSMQIYKQMNIATAKLTKLEQKRIKHHLISCIDLKKSFSVVDFIKFAKIALKKINSKNKKPILVGGTGFYIDSFLNEINFDDEVLNDEIKLKLVSDLNRFGSNFLFEKLKQIDFEYAKKVHPNNGRRVIRALEKYYSTGIKLSESEKNSKNNFKKLNYFKIGLNFSDRQILYEKINDRVDYMMKKGLLNEAKLIFKSCKNLDSTAMQAIGYKEFKPYFLGVSSLHSCIDCLKKNTRKFAKRQLTWFRRDKNIHWFFIDEYGNVDDMFKKILILAQNFFN